MKFIGIPKDYNKPGEGLRTILGVSLLLALAFVSILGADTMFSNQRPEDEFTSSSILSESSVPSTDFSEPADSSESMIPPESSGSGEITPEPTEPAPSPEPTEAPVKETKESAVYYATAKINIRSGPGIDFDIVGSLLKGDKVNVTASTDNGWKKIGSEQYVISEFVSKTPPASALSGIFYTIGEVNVRSGPGTEYSIVKELSKGSAIEVVALTANGWYKTVRDTYVLASLCTKDKPVTPTPKPTATPKPTPKPIPEGVAEKAAAVGLSVEDFELMAGIVESERPTGSGYYEGQVWVAQVIWNRVISSKWPNSVYGVITQLNPKQFSTWKGGYTTTRAPQDSSRNAVVEAFNTAPIPRNVLFFNNNRNWDDTYEYYGEAGGNYFYTENRV